MSRDPWTPIKLGQRYCSPACGRGCTYEEHHEAWRKAHALASRLGTGWTPEVWENLGWHHRATRGVARMHERDGHLTLFFNASPQIVLHGEDPHEMLTDLKFKVLAMTSRLESDLSSVMDW